MNTVHHYTRIMKSWQKLAREDSLVKVRREGRRFCFLFRVFSLEGAQRRRFGGTYGNAFINFTSRKYSKQSSLLLSKIMKARVDVMFWIGTS